VVFLLPADDGVLVHDVEDISHDVDAARIAKPENFLGSETKVEQWVKPMGAERHHPQISAVAQGVGQSVVDIGEILIDDPAFSTHEGEGNVDIERELVKAGEFDEPTGVGVLVEQTAGGADISRGIPAFVGPQVRFAQVAFSP